MQNGDFLSQENLRQAFTDWHRPARLANNPIAQMHAVSRHTSPLPGRQPLEVARIIQAELLDALGEMQRQQTIHADHYRAAVRGKPLIQLHYVEEQPASVICEKHSISLPTYYRYLLLEFEALTNVLQTGADNASFVTAQFQPDGFPVPDLPTHYLQRTQLIDKTIELLTSGTNTSTVALAGLPGAGKTTLASAIAQHPAIQQTFPDGVLWMELGQHGNAVRAIQPWLRIVHPNEITGVTPRTLDDLSRALRASLASMRVLIAIDDVWNVNDAVALMVGNRMSRHLVTTRSPALAYALAESNVIHVGEFSTEEAKHFLSINLQGTPLLAGNTINLADEAIEKMNRLPLSVDLATRHLRYLANTHQQQRFTEVLRHIDELALPQNTNSVDSRIETSVNALSEPAKATAFCLSIFPPKPNTFSEADASAVAECTQGELNQLVDLGLLEVWRGRFTMHRAIRHYFAERNGNKIELAKNRLVAHYLRILREPAPLPGIADCSNLAIAIDEATAHQPVDVAVELIQRSSWLFEEAGLLDDLAQWVSRIRLKSTSPLHDVVLNAEAARLTWLRGRAEDAIPQLESCMAEARRLGLNDVFARCEHTLSYIQVEQAQDEAGFAGAQDALHTVSIQSKHTLAQSEIAAVRQLVMHSRLDKLRTMMARVVTKLASNHSGRADVVLAGAAVAWLDYLHGDVATTEARLRQAMQSPHTATHPLIAAITHGALARICCFEGRYVEAEDFAQMCLEPVTRDASPEFTASSYDVLGLCNLAASNLSISEQWFQAGLEYTAAYRNPLLRAVLLSSICALYLRQNNLDLAQQAAHAARQIADLATDPLLRCTARTMMAVVASISGHLDEADRLFVEARKAGAIGSNKENRWSAVQFHLHLGQHLMRREKWHVAHEELNRVLELAQQLRAREYEGRAWLTLAQVAHSTGDVLHAVEYGQRSMELLKKIGHALANDAGKWLYDNKLTGRAE